MVPPQHATGYARAIIAATNQSIHNIHPRLTRRTGSQRLLTASSYEKSHFFVLEITTRE